MKKNNGITLVALAITIVILLILTVTCTVNVDSYIQEKRITNFEKDMYNLEEEINQYYSKNKELPIINKYTITSQIEGIKNPNDNENYYIIDIRKLDIDLSFGKEFEQALNINVEQEISGLRDVYIINEESHTIYYPKGIQYDKDIKYGLYYQYTNIQLELNVLTKNYTGCYDQNSHSSVVECKKEGAQIKYGLTEGTYDLDEMPSYTEVGEHIVYYEVTKEGYETVTGSVTTLINPAPLTSIITPSNYGDSVDYRITVNGVTLDNWKIFYNDKETNEVILIYGDYLLNSTNLASSAGLVQGTGNIAEYSIYSSTSRQDLIEKLLDTTKWQSLIRSDLTDKETGKGTLDLETWVKSWNTKGYSTLYTAKSERMSDGYDGYYIGISENPTSYAQSVDETGYRNELYFPYQSQVNSCSGYWLASPAAYDDDAVMGVYYSGRINCGYYDYENFSIRPVVYLTSSVLTSGRDANEKWKIQ